MSDTTLTTEDPLLPHDDHAASDDVVDDSEPLGKGTIVGLGILGLLLIGLILAASSTGQLERLVWVAVTIVAVLVGSAALFVASNMLVSQAQRNWTRYRTLVGALVGAAGLGLLRGNRSVGALVADSQYLLLGDGEPLDITGLETEGGDLLSDVLAGIADPELVEYATGILGNIEWPILGAVLGAVAGFCSGAFPHRAARVAGTVVPALIGGWLIAENLLFRNRPDASTLTIVLWAVLGAVAGAIWAGVLRPIGDRLDTSGLRGRAQVRSLRRMALPVTIVASIILAWRLLVLIDDGSFDSAIGRLVIAAAIVAVVIAVTRLPHRPLIPRILVGGAMGAAVGGWLVPDMLGTGSLGISRTAVIVPLVLIAVRFAWPGKRTPGELADFNRRARAFIFLAPALTFLSINLVIPALRTIYTSLLGRESVEYVGLQNFDDLFSSDAFLDTSNWTNFFTSQLFWTGLVLVISGFLIGAFIHRQRNGVIGLERSGGAIGPILLGIFLLLFGAFSVIRGTFSNTLWWMLTVTVASTVMGLAIAVLAERAGRLESAAKSLVFMPMAISMVGASIIWRFQYQPRNVSKDQSGVLNALWIELGNLSQSTWPRMLLLVVLAIFMVQVVRRIYDRVSDGDTFAGYVAVLIALTYLFVELMRRSLGGFAYQPDGSFVTNRVGWLPVLAAVTTVLLLGLESRRLQTANANDDGPGRTRSFAILGGLAIVFVLVLVAVGGATEFSAEGALIADTVAFREQVTPFNNVYLMFIMIWIQSGFAMVILSAAIKAVPQDLLEAARIDGATDSQQFFHVILPQILPTIGVVVTATMVGVVKVFDIVKVSTGGNFGTNVLANDFFTEAFQFTDRGTGSAIAVVILLTVAPLLIMNVRQMQKEAV